MLLIDDRERVLYLQARESQGREVWVMPGGGLDPGETFEEAAVREVYEETGAVVPLGPCLWTRHHVYSWEGRRHSQFELIFVSRVRELALAPTRRDAYVVSHRWWALDELRRSSDSFAPREIARLLPPVLLGQYPREPVDCGV